MSYATRLEERPAKRPRQECYGKEEAKLDGVGVAGHTISLTLAMEC